MWEILPLTEDPWQVFTTDIVIDGESIHAQVEFRYLPSPDRWYVSIWDHAAGKLLVNQIPLVCSYGEINDLLKPFRFLREGRGIGSLFCLKAIDSPDTQDPAGSNILQFQVLWGDTYG